MRPGSRNDLTDVGGVAVGHHQRRGRGWLTGTTVVVPPPGTVGGVDVRGGGPGTRETDLLDPVNMVSHVDAICLTGGSAYGLDAASGVMTWLEQQGRGFQIGGDPGRVVPIVPAAVIFDLGAGAFDHRPDASFGHRAASAASRRRVRQGTTGAGTGAHAAALKGGIGSASVVLESGITVAALVVLNSGGSPVDPSTGELWGARYGIGDEFAALRKPSSRVTSPRSGRSPGRLWRPTRRSPSSPPTPTSTRPSARVSPARPTTGWPGRSARSTPTPTATWRSSWRPARCAVPEAPTDGFIRPAAARFTQLAPIIAAAADAVTRAIVHATLAATPAGDMRSYTDVLPSALRP